MPLTGKPAENSSKSRGNTRRRRKHSGKRQPARKHPAKPITPLRRNLYVLLMVAVAGAIFYLFAVRPYAYRWKICNGRKAYGVCIPFGNYVHGMDISHHQGRIDWAKVVFATSEKFPLTFVFFKATEGGDYADSTFVRNFEDAGRFGFIRGAYHFFNPNTDPIKQADFFISNVKLQSGDLPPVLDVEQVGNLTTEELRKRVKLWLDRVEAHYHVKPILYASYKFKMRHLNTPIFDPYLYWIAHYYVDAVRFQGMWRFWQHTDMARVEGIEKPVDLNVFNGTSEDLKQIAIP